MARKLKSSPDHHPAVGDGEDPCLLSRKETRNEFNMMLGLAWRAKENPYRMFAIDEIASMMTISIDAVHVLRKCGAPFPFGKTRPEWLIDFMKTHGEISLKSDSTHPGETKWANSKFTAAVAAVAGAIITLLFLWFVPRPTVVAPPQATIVRPITVPVAPPASKKDDLPIAIAVLNEYREPIMRPEKTKISRRPRKKTEPIQIAGFGSTVLAYDKGAGALRFYEVE